MATNLFVYDNAQSLQHAVANAWMKIANDAIAKRGQCHIALSGGSTPKALYQLIASPEFIGQCDWPHCHIYFGDERYVALDHEDSNYRMAKLAMFDELPIPTTNIHPVNTALSDVQACALAYQATLDSNIPLAENGMPVFDLMLQGIGTDGHTASLFPGTAAIFEKERKVVAVYVEKLDSWRISVTLPVINQARNVIVLASGDAKKAIVHELFMQPVANEPYPIQLLQPTGEYAWYVDESAAADVSGDFVVRP